MSRWNPHSALTLLGLTSIQTSQQIQTKTSLRIRTFYGLIHDVKAKPIILDLGRKRKCMARITFSLRNHASNVTRKWFGPTADMHALADIDICSLKSKLFWDFTQRRLVVCYRSFGITYLTHFQGLTLEDRTYVQWLTLENGTDTLSANISSTPQGKPEIKQICP
jgi:hypothetical protein